MTRPPVLPDRAETVPGDLFGSVPAADAYLLKSVLHDWKDERCVHSRIHEAMPEHRAVFLVNRCWTRSGSTSSCS